MSPFIEIFTPQNFITYRINLIYGNHQYLAFAAIHQTDGWTDGQIDKDRDKKKRHGDTKSQTDKQITFFNEDPILAYNRNNVLFIDRVLIQSFRSNRYSGILRVISKIGTAPKGNIKQQGIDSKCKLITVLIRNSHI